MKRFVKYIALIGMIILPLGCSASPKHQLYYGANDRAKIMSEPTIKKLNSMAKLLHQSSGAHLVLITQKASTLNPGGAIDYLKRYRKEHSNAQDIVILVWHHAHAQAEIITSDSLSLSVSALDQQSILSGLQKRLSELGLNPGLTYAMMSLGSKVAKQFNVNFQQLLQKAPTDLDNLNANNVKWDLT